MITKQNNNQITWEKDQNNTDVWNGYYKSIKIFQITYVTGNCYFISLIISNITLHLSSYTTLRSAKRGAERILKSLKKNYQIKQNNNKIIWEKSETPYNAPDYYGYFNKINSFNITPIYNVYVLSMCISGRVYEDIKDYTTLKSAKRGAERILKEIQKKILK